jgi:hypothetical protein
MKVSCVFCTAQASPIWVGCAHCRSIFWKSYWVYYPPNVEGYHNQSTNWWGVSACAAHIKPLTSIKNWTADKNTDVTEVDTKGCMTHHWSVQNIKQGYNIYHLHAYTRKVGWRVPSQTFFFSWLMMFVTELPAPYTAYIRSMGTVAVNPDRTNDAISSHMTLRREYLNFSRPRSTAVKSFAGFLPPIPTVLSDFPKPKVTRVGHVLSLQ